MANIVKRVRGVVARSFRWESYAEDGIRTITLNAVAWIVARILELPVYGDPLFWVATIPGTFLLLGTVHAMRTAGPLAPDLRGQITRIAIGEVREMVGIMLILRIRNLGAPTAIDDWSTYIELSDGERILPSMEHSEKVRLGDTRGRVTEYNASDLIYVKTIEPIQRGAQVVGLLILTVSDLPRSALEHSQTKVHVAFSDVFGNRYEVGGRLGVLRAAAMPYTPGLLSQELASLDEESGEVTPSGPHT